MYARYFFHLHTLSSHPQGLVRLCCLFESLLHTHQPRLAMHLAVRCWHRIHTWITCWQHIGFDPLSVAVPWMVQGFAGFLPVEQACLRRLSGA